MPKRRILEWHCLPPFKGKMYFIQSRALLFYYFNSKVKTYNFFLRSVLWLLCTKVNHAHSHTCRMNSVRGDIRSPLWTDVLGEYLRGVWLFLWQVRRQGKEAWATELNCMVFWMLIKQDYSEGIGTRKRQKKKPLGWGGNRKKKSVNY